MASSTRMIQINITYFEYYLTFLEINNIGYEQKHINNLLTMRCIAQIYTFHGVDSHRKLLVNSHLI